MHTLNIYQDTDAESPRDWCNLGTMYCEHRRYSLGDDKAEDIRTEENGFPRQGFTILPLYLYDNWGITISTGAFNCPWDSGQVGYIYVSNDNAYKVFGWRRITAKRREYLRELLRREVDTYDCYLRGAVYSFELLDEDGECIDSCSGFYGDDPESNGMADHLPVPLTECEVNFK